MASRKRVAEQTTVTNKKKKSNARKRQTQKLIILGIEILSFVILLAVVYVWTLFAKIEADPDFDDLQAGINEDIDEDTMTTLDGYTNIALFGLDNRLHGQYDRGQSDVIMIASINNKTKEVKLVSVYRDTFLSIGSGRFGKANSAYTKGGAKQAVQMLNANLDLNIKEYACVDWGAVVAAIDSLGGVEIEITEQEVGLINTYIPEVHVMMGTEYDPVTESGLVTLTGTQATGYARIRKTAGSDFKRTSRQRIVLEAMLNKAKQSDIKTLMDICATSIDDISTSLNLGEIIALAKDVQKYKITSTSGFPFEITTGDLATAGDAVIPIGLEDDVSALHEYLFGTEEYMPSKTVQAISDAIVTKTGVTEDYKSINVDDFNDTAGQTGTNFKD